MIMERSIDNTVKSISLEYNGRYAQLLSDKDGYVWVQWRTRAGAKLKKWRTQYEPLLAIVREYCDKNELSLWSY